MLASLPTADNLPPRWGSRRGNTALAARIDSWASANVATPICAPCWFTLRCGRPSPKTIDSVSGSSAWRSALTPMWAPSPRPTKRRAWRGRCCVMTRITNPGEQRPAPFIPEETAPHHDCDATRAMANRSNRRGKLLKCPGATSTEKRMGAGARIAHHGPASKLCRSPRPNIRAQSARAPKRRKLAMRGSPYTDIGLSDEVNKCVKDLFLNGMACIVLLY